MKSFKLKVKNKKLERVRSRGASSQNFELFTSNFSLERSGFTLLEVVVATGLFSVIMVLAVSVILAISGAEVKSRNTQTIQDNLRYTLESMTRELRTGVDYRPSGVSGIGYAQIVFTRQDGAEVGYCLLNGAVQKLEGTSDCTSGSAVTSADITVDTLTFHVGGDALGEHVR